jgi:hypothetical protein
LRRCRYVGPDFSTFTVQFAGQPIHTPLLDTLSSTSSPLSYATLADGIAKPDSVRTAESMFGQQPDLQQQRAAELAVPPPKGHPYSVPIPGSQVEGQSAVYRHWRFADKPLLEILDPAVRLCPHLVSLIRMCFVLNVRANESLPDHDGSRGV